MNHLDEPSSLAITPKRCHGGGELSQCLPPKRPRDMAFTASSLLPELVIEILSRLPVKSLLRFRCVCRAWKVLISDSFFVKKHLYLSRRDFQFDRSRWLICSGVPEDPFSFKAYRFRSIYGFTDSMEIDYLLKDRTRCDWVVGSCDGLICISIRQDAIILLNPTLRQSKMLPSLGFKKRKGSYTVFGFGFDASAAGDYKVVRIFCYQSKDFEPWYETIVRVYSLRTNTWRRIQGFPYGDPSDEAGKHVNGTLNWWVVRSVGAELVWNIMSLDLAAETYMEILQPDYGDGVNNKTLGVLGGSLCVLGNRPSHADVWVMREYGVRESWNKLFSIPYIDREPALFGAPLMIAENGQVLLQCGTRLYLYNPKDRTFRLAMVIGDVLSNFEPTIYIESLVSPVANNWL